MCVCVCVCVREKVYIYVSICVGMYKCIYISPSKITLKESNRNETSCL